MLQCRGKEPRLRDVPRDRSKYIFLCASLFVYLDVNVDLP